jgi:hypothetical protein
MEATVYSATFTFAKKQFDDAFFALDAAISKAAKQTPGYLGEENWENAITGLCSNVYYWDSLEALQLMMQHPDHVLAKENQAQWLNGYQVTIAKLLRNYGDGKIPCPFLAH